MLSLLFFLRNAATPGCPTGRGALLLAGWVPVLQVGYCDFPLGTEDTGVPCHLERGESWHSLLCTSFSPLAAPHSAARRPWRSGRNARLDTPPAFPGSGAQVEQSPLFALRVT